MLCDRDDCYPEHLIRKRLSFPGSLLDYGLVFVSIFVCDFGTNKRDPFEETKSEIRVSADFRIGKYKIKALSNKDLGNVCKLSRQRYFLKNFTNTYFNVKWL